MPYRAKPTGFTLLELLIVLVLIGFATAFAGPRLFQLIEPDANRDLPVQIIQRIDRVRSEAILKAEIQRISWDLATGSYTDSHGTLALPENWYLTLAPETENQPTPKPSADSDQQYEFALKPDGSTDAYPIEVHGPDKQGFVVQLSRYTSKVSTPPFSDETPHAAP